MVRIILVALSLVCVCLVSCGYKEGIIQKSDVSYIKFVGNLQEATVQIDDLQAFTPSAPDKVYQLSPGKHVVKAFRNGQLVVHRTLVLDNSVTMEVTIP